MLRYNVLGTAQRSHRSGLKPDRLASFSLLIWILLGFLAFRLWLTLGHDALLGVDGGAYLDGLRITLGGADLGVGFPRPPLAPGLMLWPFIELFGIDNGYKIWSSIASVLPAIPVYLMARRIHSRFPSTAAVFAAGFLLLDILHAEMLVTGALPLIGFALLGMVIWAMGETEEWSFKKGFTLAICLGLIPWVNQTTAGLALITIPVYGLALWFFHSNWWTEDNRTTPYGNPPVSSPLTLFTFLGPFMILGGIIGLAALPWYLDVLPVSGVLNYPGPYIYFSPWTDSSWLQVFLALPIGIFVVVRGIAPWMKALGVLICVYAALSPFLSTDETVINLFYRSRYLLAIPFYVAITWIVFTFAIPRFNQIQLKLAAAAAIGVAILLVVGYWWTFNNQAGYSDMVSRETQSALSITSAINDKAIINNSFTLALWIAGLNEVEAPHTWTWQPPPTWQETDKHVRCVLGWVPACDPFASIEKLNAGWVLIEKRFPYYNDRAPGVYGSLNVEEPWIDLPSIPWLELTYAEGTTELYAIRE